MLERHFVDILFRGFTKEELFRFPRMFVTALGQLICQRSADAIHISSWVIFKQLALDPFAVHHNSTPRTFIIIAFSFGGYKTRCNRQFNPWGNAFTPVGPFFVVSPTWLCACFMWSLSMMSSTSCFVQVHLLRKALTSWLPGGDDISTGILSHPSSMSAKTAYRSSEGRKALQEILLLSAVWDRLHSTSLNVFDVIKSFDHNVSNSTLRHREFR